MSPYLERPCDTIEQVMDRLIRDANELAEAGLFNLALLRMMDVVRLESFMRKSVI